LAPNLDLPSAETNADLAQHRPFSCGDCVAASALVENEKELDAFHAAFK
jgi:hypothetical protein